MVDSILFVQTHGIGDVIMCLPAIRVLRQKKPEAKITILVKSKTEASILENLNLVNEVFIYRDKKLFRLFRLLWMMRRRKFKAGIVGYAVNPRLASLLFSLIGVHNSIGFPKNLKTRPFAQTLDERPGHKIHKNLQLLEGLGIRISNKQDYRPEWILSTQESNWAHSWFNKQKLDGKIVIGFTPGSGKVEAHKQWPIENFHILTDQILKTFKKNRMLIFGNSSDHKLGNSIARSFGERVINLAGQFTLRQTAALISQCAVIVGGDNGLLHIAASLGIPTLALFGPTNFNLTGPYGDSVRMISLNLDCSPCYHSLLKGCSNPICMSELNPQLVMNEISNLLNI